MDTVPGLVTVVETMKSVCHSERWSKSRHCIPLFCYALIVRNGYEMYVCTTSRTFSGGALMRIVVSSVALNQAVMVVVSRWWECSGVGQVSWRHAELMSRYVSEAEGTSGGIADATTIRVLRSKSKSKCTCRYAWIEQSSNPRTYVVDARKTHWIMVSTPEIPSLLLPLRLIQHLDPPRVDTPLLQRLHNSILLRPLHHYLLNRLLCLLRTTR